MYEISYHFTFLFTGLKSPFAEENPIISRNSFVQTEFGGDLGEKIKAQENMEGEGEGDEGIDMTTDLLSAYPNSANLLSDSESDGDDTSDSDSDPDDHKFDFKRKISVRDRNLQNGDRKAFDLNFAKNGGKNSKQGVDKAIEGDMGTFEVEFGSRDDVDGEGVEASNENENSSDQKNKTNFRRNSEFSLMLPTWQLSEITEPVEENKSEKNIPSEKSNVLNVPAKDNKIGIEKQNKIKPGTFLTLDIDENQNSVDNNKIGSEIDMNDNEKKNLSQSSFGTQTSTKNNDFHNNQFTNPNSTDLFSPHSPNANAFFSAPTFSYPSSPVDVRDMMKIGLNDGSLSNIDDNNDRNNFNNNENKDDNNHENRKVNNENPDEESHNILNEFNEDGKVRDRDIHRGEGDDNTDDREEYGNNGDYDDDSIDQHKFSLIDDEFDNENMNSEELNGNQGSQNIPNTYKKMSPEKYRKQKLSIDTYMSKDDKKNGPKQPWIRSCSPYAPGGKKKSHSQILDELSGKEMEKEKVVLRERLRSLTKDQMAAEVKKLQSKNIRRMSQSPSDAVRNSLLASPNSSSFNFLNSPSAGRMSLLESPTSGRRDSILEPSSPRSVHSENVSVLGSSKSSVASHLSKSSIVSRSHSRGKNSIFFLLVSLRLYCVFHFL